MRQRSAGLGRQLAASIGPWRRSFSGTAHTHRNDRKTTGILSRPKAGSRSPCFGFFRGFSGFWAAPVPFQVFLCSALAQHDGLAAPHCLGAAAAAAGCGVGARLWARQLAVPRTPPPPPETGSAEGGEKEAATTPARGGGWEEARPRRRGRHQGPAPHPQQPAQARARRCHTTARCLPRNGSRAAQCRGSVGIGRGRGSERGRTPRNRSACRSHSQGRLSAAGLDPQAQGSAPAGGALRRARGHRAQPTG